jgi:uncharacterized protein
VTILDVNLLLYAHDAAMRQHAAARAWLEKLFLSGESIGFPVAVIWGFLRVSTNRQIQRRPRSPEDAFLLVRGWLAERNTELVHPGPRHVEILERLVIDYQAYGPRVSDAVLAALAIEHGATLASTNRDFSRFPNLKWVNPLEAV